jgi:hypothetical protein
LTSVFICHASEDKDTIARPLALALVEQQIDVWFDEFSMKVGDSLRETIDKGLSKSEYGIVIVSPAFFEKRWPQRELSGLVAREMASDKNIVLPVWHGADRDLILTHSAPLADIVAANSSSGLSAVVQQLMRVLRPLGSPLSIARKQLSLFDFDAPSTADDWWIDIIEQKQSLFANPEGAQRWIFPLPYCSERTPFERGHNLASTALQLNWCFDAEEKGLCQLTRPEELHAFFRSKPGMLETIRSSPSTLAIYAPQLTLRGFDEGLEDVFDQLLSSDSDEAFQAPGYGPTETVDGLPPACGDLISWRHPTFGGLTNRELGYSFVNTHNFNYSRRLHSTFDCMAWLLSDQSLWMPTELKDRLVDGIKSRALWFNDVVGNDKQVTSKMYNKCRKTFTITRGIRLDVESLFNDALGRLNIVESSTQIARRFFEHEFIDAWYQEQANLKARRLRKTFHK